MEVTTLLDDTSRAYPHGREDELVYAMLSIALEAITDEVIRRVDNESKWKSWADTRP